MSVPTRRPCRSIPWCAASALVAAVTALPSAAFQDCSFATVPGVRTLHQPDGAPIGLVFRGSALHHWYEDAAGFPVVRAEKGFVYARRAADGSLAATAELVGASDPERLGLERNVVPAPAREHAQRNAAARTIASPGPSGAFLGGAGSVDNLVLLLRFSDHGPLGQNRTLPSAADVHTIMNAVGGDPVLAPSGSVRDHYLEGSYGQFTIDSTVVGWLDLPFPESYYANASSGLTPLTWDLVLHGLQAADPLVDFGDFDADGDGRIDAITLLHSGYGAEWGGFDQYGTWYSDRMWSHKWTIPTWTSAEGVSVDDYNISPGLWDVVGSDPGRIGVVCHELGHFFGLPDLYDTDGFGEGIGNWCLMATGSWGFDGSQQYPSHMSGWCKLKLGWVSPERLVRGAHALGQLETEPEVLMLDSGYPPGEYLLLENRQPVGFDSMLPQGGLAVWHVDEKKGSFTWNDPNTDEGYPGQPGWPFNDQHYRVAMLQADGTFGLEQGWNRGDGWDVFHSGAWNVLAPWTVPDTNSYRNGVLLLTDHRIESIGAPGASMAFTHDILVSPDIQTTSLPVARVGQPYAVVLTSIGAPGPFTWTEFLDAPTYALTDLGPQPFVFGGFALGLKADEQTIGLLLPFDFPCYETVYRQVFVTPNGCVDLAPLENESNNTSASLRALPRIAGLWDDLTTGALPWQDVYYDDFSVPGQATFRWDAEPTGSGLAASFAITLRSDGSIRFDYGPGNAGLTPTVGISRGHSGDVLLAPTHDRQTSLNNANSLEFQRSGSALPPGMTLSPGGVLSGTPTVTGTYTFTVRASDPGGFYDQRELTLEVVSRTRRRTL
jgi:M6 family metalloprotease-like protein